MVQAATPIHLILVLFTIEDYRLRREPRQPRQRDGPAYEMGIIFVGAGPSKQLVIVRPPCLWRSIAVQQIPLDGGDGLAGNARAGILVGEELGQWYDRGRM